MLNMSWYELAGRFIIGGTVITAVTVIGSMTKDRFPLLAGVINNFPALTIMSVVILFTTASALKAENFIKETLITLPIYMAFLVTFFLLSKLLGPRWIVLGFSLVVWCIAATTVFYVNNLVNSK